jgi:hypothetical protein
LASPAPPQGRRCRLLLRCLRLMSLIKQEVPSVLSGLFKKVARMER